MPYTAEINRTNPSCFLFLVDQSGSMCEPMAGDPTKTKAKTVADIINKTLCELTIKCTKSDGLRDYFHVGIIGYGASVGSAFAGSLAGKDLVTIRELAENPARLEERIKKVDDGAGGVVETKVRFAIWIEPSQANAPTPMCQALAHAHGILSTWLPQHPDCYPPTIIHITDGQASDGDFSPVMKQLHALSSSDGPVLVFNIHVTSHEIRQVVFPTSMEASGDPYALALFNSASQLTPMMRSVAKEQGHAVGDTARAFIMNSDLAVLVQAMDIGTRVANNL